MSDLAITNPRVKDLREPFIRFVLNQYSVLTDETDRDVFFDQLHKWVDDVHIDLAVASKASKE
jgi:hypothetical protein